MRVESVRESDPALDELENQLKRSLARLQQEYAEAARPILQRLAGLDALRPRQFMVVFEPGDDVPQHVKDLLK